MQEHIRIGNPRKSLRKSQTIRYFVSARTATLVSLLLIFVLCIGFRGLSRVEKHQYFFPIKYQQKDNTTTLNILPQLNKNESSIERQIQQYCQDVKCHSQQIKILNLISNIMKQHIVIDYAIPSEIEPEKQIRVLLPRIVDKSQERQKNLQNLIEYMLTAAEHQQLSTPLSKQTYFQQLLDIFYPHRPYQGINCLFQNCNVLWQPKILNSLLTVQTHQKIKPNIIEIQSKADASTKMEVIGLVQSPTNELLGLHLGRFQLKPGINWLHCKKSHCFEQYSMILFKIETMKLSKLKIYRKMMF